jgi:hypothetical protein
VSDRFERRTLLGLGYLIGGLTMLVDPEVGRDTKYTRNIGVDPDKLIIPQPKDELGKPKKKKDGEKDDGGRASEICLVRAEFRSVSFAPPPLRYGGP